MNARKPAQCVARTRYRKRGLNWARGHVGWVQQQWRQALYTDESIIYLASNQGRVRVCGREGESCFDACTADHDRKGGGSIMAWGGIAYRSRTRLYVVSELAMTGVEYRDEILEPVLVSCAENAEKDFMFMDDNVGPHKGRIVTQYLENHGIQRMNWPEKSPDLSPIGYGWNMMVRSIGKPEDKSEGLLHLGVSLEAA